MDSVIAVFDIGVRFIGKAIELLGVLTILVGILYSLIKFFSDKKEAAEKTYQSLRIRIGRSILLGLELLVAGDIIGTVALSPTFNSLGLLAIVVFIRTFLSFALEVELTGRWPWQK